MPQTGSISITGIFTPARPPPVPRRRLRRDAPASAPSCRKSIRSARALPARRPTWRARLNPVHRYRATVAYVGTFFNGWQRQENARRTVQAVVERALGRVAAHAVTINAAGRTDAGVHAEGQVVHFDLDRDLEPERVRDGANAWLPWDAKVLEAARAPDTFHARRDALWKEYVYRWSRAAVIRPSEALFVSPLSAGADVARMAEAIRRLPGDRDYGVFAVRQPKGESGVRLLLSAGVEERGPEVRAVFRGEGFLRGMVRSICGVLGDVGRGKAPVGRVEELLATGDRRLLSPKAPAAGLTLLRVAYTDLP